MLAGNYRPLYLVSCTLFSTAWPFSVYVFSLWLISLYFIFAVVFISGRTASSICNWFSATVHLTTWLESGYFFTTRTITRSCRDPETAVSIISGRQVSFVKVSLSGGTTFQTTFPLSFGESFVKIRSAVPENCCLIVLVDGKKQKKTKKTKKQLQNI